MEEEKKKKQIVFHQHAASVCSNFNLFSGCCPRHDRSVGIICRWDFGSVRQGSLQLHTDCTWTSGHRIFRVYISFVFPAWILWSGKKTCWVQKSTQPNSASLQQKLAQDNLETTSEIISAWPAPTAQNHHSLFQWESTSSIYFWACLESGFRPSFDFLPILALAQSLWFSRQKFHVDLRWRRFHFHIFCSK